MANPNITVVGPRTGRIAPTIGQTLALLQRQKQIANEQERLEKQFQFKIRQQAREDMEKRLKFHAENSPETPIQEYGTMLKSMHSAAGEQLLAGGSVEGFYKQMGELKMMSQQIKTMHDKGMSLYAMADKNPLVNRENIGKLLTDVYLDKEGNIRNPYDVGGSEIDDITKNPNFWNKEKAMAAYAEGVQETVLEKIGAQSVMGDFTKFDIVKTANKFALMKNGEVQYDPDTGNILLNITGEQVNRMRNNESTAPFVQEKMLMHKDDPTYTYKNAVEDLITESGYAAPKVESEVEIAKGHKADTPSRYIGGSAKDEARALSRVENTVPILTIDGEAGVMSKIRGKSGIVDTKVIRSSDPMPDDAPQWAKDAMSKAGLLSDKKLIAIEFDARRMKDVPIQVKITWEGETMSQTEKGKEPETGTRYILVDPNLDTKGMPNPALIEINNWINGTDPVNVSSDNFTDAYKKTYGTGEEGEEDNNIEEQLGSIAWPTQKQ